MQERPGRTPGGARNSKTCRFERILPGSLLVPQSNTPPRGRRIMLPIVQDALRRAHRRPPFFEDMWRRRRRRRRRRQRRRRKKKKKTNRTQLSFRCSEGRSWSRQLRQCHNYDRKTSRLNRIVNIHTVRSPNKSEANR